jgi:uncharacterized membrane protein
MSKQDKKYWLKLKNYGYGWRPSTWQGWALIAVYLSLVLASALILLKDVPDGTYQTEVGVFIGVVVVLTALVAFIAHSKGPKAEWRWRKNPSSKKVTK